MTSWIPSLTGKSGPIYQQIADAIADGIKSGELAPKTRLPPQRDLAWKLKVTVGTVSRAYLAAEQKGLLSGEVGRGTFVKPPATAPSVALYQPPADGMVDLSINAALSNYHGAMLERALSEIAAQRGLESLLVYMTTVWQTPHKEAARRWLAQSGVHAAPERIVLTNGAHQAIAVAFAALPQPGASALTDRFTYPGIIDNARVFGHPLLGVEGDSEGMVPDLLERAAAESGAKTVFLQPTIHNPSTRTMSEQRRRDIIAVARRRELLLVEDDVYGLLPADRPPPIAALAPDITVYISSASKSFAPGLRIGWMLGPERYAQALGETRYTLSGQLPGLSFEVARRWIESGVALDLMRRMRAETAARQRLAAERLAGLAVDAAPNAFHLVVHLPQPWRREEFVAAALARGVLIAPISAFAVGQAPAPHAVRVSIAAAPDQASLARALGVIRALALVNKAAACREVV